MDRERLAKITTLPSDLERFATMTPEQRLALFAELCDLTDAVVRGRPHPERLLEPVRRSAEAEALWRRLMKAG